MHARTYARTHVQFEAVHARVCTHAQAFLYTSEMQIITCSCMSHARAEAVRQGPGQAHMFTRIDVTCALQDALMETEVHTLCNQVRNLALFEAFSISHSARLD